MPVGAMEELWMSQGAQGSESHLTITGITQTMQEPSPRRDTQLLCLEPCRGHL